MVSAAEAEDARAQHETLAIKCGVAQPYQRMEQAPRGGATDAGGIGRFAEREGFAAPAEGLDYGESSRERFDELFGGGLA